MADTFVRRSGRRRQLNFKYSLDPDELRISSSNSDEEDLRQLIDDGEDEFVHTNLDDDRVEKDSIANVSDESESLEIEEPTTSKSLADSKFSRWQKKKEQSRHEHSRGIIEQTHIQGKEAILNQLFGSDPQDWINVLRSRDQWLAEPTLPKTLAHHFSHTEEMRSMEAGEGWNWYYQGGKDLFSDRQKVRVLSLDEGFGYIWKPKSSQKLLMGPYGKQREFNLQHWQSVYLDEAWKGPEEKERDEEMVGEREGERKRKRKRDKRGKRDGWILNIGSAISCLDWAPNQDNTQYLAIATRPKSDSKLSKVSPAYTPSSLPSNIQIWAFPAKNSTFLPPKLQLVICTEWGHVKQLKWCPMPRTFRDQGGKKSIGLLAGIWADGYIRILDIYLESLYVKYDTAAFESRPPNTLCTCLVWLSPTDIAVGCANGFLAIWDILIPSPSPWLYMSIHRSYILAICNAYPSHPHLLASSSIDGYMRLSDLRAPGTDWVLSPRSRIASAVLTFSPPLLSFISTEENDYVRIYPLRCFYTSISIARTSAFPLCLAVGHFHPTVLVGCTDGTLIATNPLRRALYRRCRQYQQLVWRHEWNRQGIARWTEGYKLSGVALQRTGGDVLEGVMSTIWEEEGGVGQVGWNPNLGWGGWVAAGTESGFVRVQDLVRD